MKKAGAYKYLLVFTLPILTFVSFNSTGWLTFAPLIEAFILIPVLELFFKPDAQNISAAEESLRREDRHYDWLVYSVVPIQFICLFFFLDSVTASSITWFERVGRISAMGLMCGVIGINVAHELGHRNKKYEQLLSKMLLLTSLYMHFFIEHNRGHHKNVSTLDDPASSRRNENLYAFWVRSTWNSYWSAWRLEKERLAKKGLGAFSIQNEMLAFQIIQLTLLGVIFFFFGWMGLIQFVLAATMGFLLLETVNYIEHYGLQRSKTESGTYERVMPHHSWNSDHIVGRMMLFELSRHSDHHYLANRKYQILRHIDHSPQMPTGYPGMMLMALVPPLWFRVMNKELEKFQMTAV